MGNGNLIFFGTAAIALPFLRALRDTFDLRLIITQPDAVGGRSRKPLPPAVKSFATAEDIPCIQPEKLRSPEVSEQILAYSPRIAVVVAYGKIIPKSIFSLPEHHTVNVHFSLLPAYRGAAPVQRAIENGDTTTGITIFEIDRQMDTGDIWAQRQYPIGAADTSASVLERLSREGVPFLIDTLREILRGGLKKTPQDPTRATPAPPITKEEGRVDWTEPASRLVNRLRAFTPWPGLYFYTGEKMFKIREMTAHAGGMRGESPQGESGTVLRLDREGLLVACGSGTEVVISEFQPQGKRAMHPFAYSLGNPMPRRLN